jgi:hypothetical protein
MVRGYSLEVDIHDSFLGKVSDNMFTNTNMCVDEITMNSYDALASYCSIDFDKTNDFVRFIDDGCGMKGTEGLKPFITAGLSTKHLENIVMDGSRVPVGHFGFAKLCMCQIGKVLELETMKDGVHSSFKTEADSLIKKGTQIYVDEAACEPSKHGTIITIRDLKPEFMRQFDPVNYRIDARWRLPIGDQFGFRLNVDGKKSPARREPEDTEVFPIEHELAGKGVLKGAIYLTKSQYSQYGYHVYVHHRRAFNTVHSRFPWLTMPQAGMNNKIVIMVNADFLNDYILFTREHLKECEEASILHDVVQKKLHQVRNFMERQREEQKKFISDLEHRSSAASKISAPPESFNPIKEAISRFADANLPEFPKGTSIIPNNAISMPLRMVSKGNFIINLSHPALAGGINSYEQLGRISYALVQSIAKHRANDGQKMADIERDIWRRIPAYSGNGQKNAATHHDECKADILSDAASAAVICVRKQDIRAAATAAPIKAKQEPPKDSLGKDAEPGNGKRTVGKPLENNLDEHHISSDAEVQMELERLDADLKRAGVYEPSSANFSSGSRQTIRLRQKNLVLDADRNYSFSELIGVTKHSHADLSYIWPAFGKKMDESLKGSDLLEFESSSKGCVTLHHLFNKILNDKDPVQIASAHVIFSGQCLEPFVINYSTRKSGAVYLVNQACTVAIYNEIKRGSSVSGASHNSIRSRLAGLASLALEQSQLMSQGSFTYEEVNNIIDHARKTFVNLHKVPKEPKKIAFKAFAEAALDYARNM